MWRRTYLLLILVRLYFALSPSYLHPDENFQGPEAIAGRVFSYPVHLTWEFTSEHPVRSSLPLWIAYGAPMYILRSIWDGTSNNEVPPSVVYWTLRVLMLMLSFVLEDWAIQELIQSPRQRRAAVLLVASSYVTWTWQTHTFSNSLETLILSWSLVLITRIHEDKKHSGVLASSVLGVLLVIGVFNRPTFPAYIIVPMLRLLPHFGRKPLSALFLAIFGIITFAIAVTIDTDFYNPDSFTFSDVLHRPVIAPLNNFIYNIDSSNLAQHGIHPFYQHFVANLPQLMGPAFPLVFYYPRKMTLRYVSAISGIVILSLVPHQEARFLLPAIPLLLSAIRVPKKMRRVWISAWIVFNVSMGILMGIFHQGGVVPVQMHLATHATNITDVVWWKTYSPPVWLLDGKNERLVTTDLMGTPGIEMIRKLQSVTDCEGASAPQKGLTFLVAPRSASFLGPYISTESGTQIKLEEVWSYRRHVNLDDLDFADDGVMPTLTRLVGERGLVVWNVRKRCNR